MASKRPCLTYLSTGSLGIKTPAVSFGEYGPPITAGEEGTYKLSWVAHLTPHWL